MAAEEPSLGQRAFKHAVSRTINAYKKHIEGIGGQIVVTVFSLGITASVNGGVAAVLSDINTLGIVIAANVGWVFILFVWHLWLAPNELVFEALKQQKSAKQAPAHSVVPPVASAKKFDFLPIKLRAPADGIDGYELARTLAAIGAGGDIGTSASCVGYEKTIFAAMQAGKLTLIPEQWRSPGGYYDAPVDIARKVTKESAIKWAESIGVNMGTLK